MHGLACAALLQGAGQHLHVLQTQVEALTGQRMHAMRGVANQHQTIGHGAAGQLALQAPGCGGAGGLQRPEVLRAQGGQVRFDALRQSFGRQVEQFQRQRLGGRPDQRHHRPTLHRRQRQQGDHAAICKGLEGDALVRCGAEEIGDHAALQVVVRIHRDARDLAHQTVLAVGADEQRGLQGAAVIGLHLPACRRGLALQPRGLGRVDHNAALEAQRQIERGFDGAGFDDPGQRLAAGVAGIEGELGAIGADVHGLYGLNALRRHLRPDPQLFEQLP